MQPGVKVNNMGMQNFGYGLSQNLDKIIVACGVGMVVGIFGKLVLSYLGYGEKELEIHQHKEGIPDDVRRNELANERAEGEPTLQ